MPEDKTCHHASTLTKDTVGLKKYVHHSTLKSSVQMIAAETNRAEKDTQSIVDTKTYVEEKLHVCKVTDICP